MTASSRVRIIGDPVLRKKGRIVSFPEDRTGVDELLIRMFTLLQKEEGLGLAAPQVGESLRVFIALPNYLDELQGHTVFINPEIEPFGNMEKREEGCLSIPGIYETLERPSMARVSAVDEKGNRFALEVSGLAARLVQHENDHLDGILYVDRLSPMKKKLLKRKLRNLREQESSS